MASYDLDQLVELADGPALRRLVLLAYDAGWSDATGSPRQVAGSKRIALAIEAAAVEHHAAAAAARRIAPRRVED